MRCDRAWAVMRSGASATMGPGSSGCRRIVACVVVGRGVPQPLDVRRRSHGEVDVDGVGHPVEGEPLEDAGQAEAVVAVGVGDEDAPDR
jgi:hypothetical protein